MSGADDVNLQEFIDFFPDIQLPFSYADSSLAARSADSLKISPEIFNGFAPDSVLKHHFGEQTASLYAVGKFTDKSGAIYLLSKGVTKAKRILLLTAYDKDHQFLTDLAAMTSPKKGSHVSLHINTMFNITRRTVKTLPNEIEISGEDVYVLNSAARKFMLVMTDALGNDDELINPIDTLGTEWSYAGDYGKGARNLISIRDDNRPGRIRFYIHLEEAGSPCQGELKGNAIITGDNTAEYRSAGDPCMLRFTFSDNRVQLTEIEGCGSRMGALDCTFNGRYPKKKADLD
ncbi:hypothetical protein [Niabella terrae]